MLQIFYHFLYWQQDVYIYLYSDSSVLIWLVTTPFNGLSQTISKIIYGWHGWLLPIKGLEGSWLTSMHGWLWVLLQQVPNLPPSTGHRPPSLLIIFISSLTAMEDSSSIVRRKICVAGYLLFLKQLFGSFLMVYFITFTWKEYIWVIININESTTKMKRIETNN